MLVKGATEVRYHPPHKNSSVSRPTPPKTGYCPCMVVISCANFYKIDMMQQILDDAINIGGRAQSQMSRLNINPFKWQRTQRCIGKHVGVHISTICLCKIVVINHKVMSWDASGLRPLRRFYWPHVTTLTDPFCLYRYDVIKWKHFPRYWPFVRGIHRSPVNSPHKGQWCGALMFSFTCVWISGWVNNREAGDSRRHRADCDVILMMVEQDLSQWKKTLNAQHLLSMAKAELSHISMG